LTGRKIFENEVHHDAVAFGNISLLFRHRLMVLVAEHRHRDLDLSLVAFPGCGLALLAALDRPPPVTVDLSAPRRRPLARRPAALIVSFSI
jgi:hypothetical protein